MEYSTTLPGGDVLSQIIAPQLNGLRAVPSVDYLVLVLVGVGARLNGVNVTVVNVRAACHAVILQISHNNLSVVNAVGCVSQNNRVKLDSVLPVLQILTGNNLVGVGLVTYEYSCVVIDSRNSLALSSLDKTLVVNRVTSLGIEYIVASLLRVGQNLNLVVVARLAVGNEYRRNLAALNCAVEGVLVSCSSTIVNRQSSSGSSSEKNHQP